VVVRVEPYVERVQAIHGDTARTRTSPSVADLARSASNGDQLAWRELVVRFGGMIEAIGRRHGLCSQEIGQLQQTTWLGLVENLDRIGDRDHLGAWLAATARQASLEMIKHLAS
jgi:DNA-directed RNA polymerase specialized sigma24 family protein